MTAWKSETFLSNVIVAPSVSAVSVPLMLAIEGVVSVGLVCNTGFPVPVGVLFFISFPVVPLKRTGTESVEEAGQTTSPEPPPLEIVTVTSLPTFVAVTPEPTKLKEETALVIVVPSSFTGMFALAVIVKSPLPRTEFPLIVFMFVPDTKIA